MASNIMDLVNKKLAHEKAAHAEVTRKVTNLHSATGEAASAVSTLNKDLLDQSVAFSHNSSLVSAQKSLEHNVQDFMKFMGLPANASCSYTVSDGNFTLSCNGDTPAIGHDDISGTVVLS